MRRPVQHYRKDFAVVVGFGDYVVVVDVVVVVVVVDVVVGIVGWVVVAEHSSLRFLGQPLASLSQ